MSIHNLCFYGEIRKILTHFVLKSAISITMMLVKKLLLESGIGTVTSLQLLNTIRV